MSVLSRPSFDAPGPHSGQTGITMQSSSCHQIRAGEVTSAAPSQIRPFIAPIGVTTV